MVFKWVLFDDFESMLLQKLKPNEQIVFVTNIIKRKVALSTNSSSQPNKFFIFLETRNFRCRTKPIAVFKKFFKICKFWNIDNAVCFFREINQKYFRKIALSIFAPLIILSYLQCLLQIVQHLSTFFPIFKFFLFVIYFVVNLF